MPVSKGRRPGTWRVTVWAHGRQHEQIFEGSKTEAMQLEASERLRLGNKRSDPLRSAPVFSAFSTGLYRPWAEGHLAASTWSVRKYQIDTLTRSLGEIRLCDLKSQDVDHYVLARREEVSDGAINNELRVLRAMLGWARERSIAVGPCRVKLLRTGQRRVHFWTRAEVMRVFASARKHAPELLALIVFMVNTGLRKGEALAAEWSWVDRKTRTLRVPVTSEWMPKSKKPREVPLSRAALAALSGPRKDERWIFPSSLGTRYKLFPRRRFSVVTEAAKVKGGPHTTRHTFATHFLAEVPDLHLLARVLGHSSTRTTELYGHLLPDHLARARGAVDLAAAR